MADNNKIIWYSVFGVLGGFALLGIFYKRKEISETISNWMQPTMGKITSPFGSRIHPITKIPTFHNGIDIAAPNGTPIKAPMDGVVEKIWTDDSSGNAINIKHINDIVSGYAHLSKFNVKQGQQVKKGDVIGYVGSTGKSTGNHLHFVIKTKNKQGGWEYADPQKFIKLT